VASGGRSRCNVPPGVVVYEVAMDRRRFLQNATALGGALLSAPLLEASKQAPGSTPVSRVAFVKTADRPFGVARAIDLLGLKGFQGRDLFIKPNFNSADAFPGSTHNDTLVTLIRKLKNLKAGPLTIGDRSGMGDTRGVMESKGIFKLGAELGAKVVVLDEVPGEHWEIIQNPEFHWRRGFALPQTARNAGGIVTTCCLKTHRFGGHFTLSLKNSVGLAAKHVPTDPYNYMHELHSSPHQRRMIAEINTAYVPELVVLDGVQAFSGGGPEAGTLVNTNVILAGTDRVAIDAVGVAILRSVGTTPEVSRGPIFQLEQIARAAELGVGVNGPGYIELVTGDPLSAEYAGRVRDVLAAA
jgi:uncharacterized protein (DUF362 family)